MVNCVKVITLRFTCAVFGLSSSPFLLNATIKHHIEQFEQCEPDFTRKFIESIYVDDLTLGDSDVEICGSLSPIQENCGRELRTMRDWFQEKQVLELEGMLTSKLLTHQ